MYRLSLVSILGFGHQINSERALSLSISSVISQFVQVCQRLFFIPLVFLSFIGEEY
jgi:hypothetical protein